MSVPGILGGVRSQPGNLMLGYGPMLGDMIQVSAGLISRWPLNEASGTVGHDYESAHDLVFHGSPTFDVPSAPGQYAIGLGTGDYIQATGTINTAVGGVEIWFRLASFPASNALVAGFYDSATKTDKCLYVTASGVLNWLVNDGAAKTITAPFVLSLNRWYQVVGSVDGTTSTLYVNGAAVASTAAGNTLVTYGNSGNFWIGGGPADTWAKLPGIYSEAAVYSVAPDAAAIFSRYNEGGANLFSESARVTQVATEVLRDSSARKARVTQLTTEVLRNSSTTKGRVTQVATEVLRTTATGLIHSVTASSAVLFTSTGAGVKENLVPVHASSAILFTVTSHKNRLAIASAESSFTVHAASSGFDAKSFSVFATSEVLIHPASSESVVHGSWSVSATTSVGIGSNGFDPDNPLKFLATRSGILWSPTATAFKITSSSAVSGFLFTYAGFHARDLQVAATSSFLVHQAGIGDPSGPRPIFVSASTSFHIAPTLAKRGVFNIMDISRIRFTCTASAYVSPINVSASSGFAFTSSAVEHCPGPLLVSALTSMLVHQSGNLQRQTILSLSAVTSFSLGQSVAFQRLAILRVSGSSSVGVGSVVSTVFDRSVAAHSALSISPAPVASRAIYVSALTSMSLTPTDKSNQFIRPTGTSSVLFVGIAGILKTGTLAGSHLLFTDLAEASVWFPWRRSGLTRPPGGFLPHS